MCGVQFKTEHWGDVVRWGPDNKQDSWEACCRTCDEQRRATGALLACNVWVWCGDKALCGAQYRECWLKHLAHPLASRPRAQGAGVPWTSGLMPQLAGSGEPEDDSDLRAAEGESPSQRKYHYIITAQNFATHWQARVNYYWWRALKAQCVQELGEDCQMGSYTRLLHSGEPDDLGGRDGALRPWKLQRRCAHSGESKDTIHGLFLCSQWTRSPQWW